LGTHVLFDPFTTQLDNRIEGFSLLVISILASATGVPRVLRTVIIALPIVACLGVLFWIIATEFINYRKHYARSNLSLIAFSKQFVATWMDRSFHDTEGFVVEEFKSEKDEMQIPLK
jgi:hypothetical protein